MLRSGDRDGDSMRVSASRLCSAQPALEERAPSSSAAGSALKPPSTSSTSSMSTYSGIPSKRASLAFLFDPLSLLCLRSLRFGRANHSIWPSSLTATAPPKENRSVRQPRNSQFRSLFTARHSRATPLFLGCCEICEIILQHRTQGVTGRGSAPSKNGALRKSGTGAVQGPPDLI